MKVGELIRVPAAMMPTGECMLDARLGWPCQREVSGGLWIAIDLARPVDWDEAYILHCGAQG
jgi:hypothetical protein